MRLLRSSHEAGTPRSENACRRLARLYRCSGADGYRSQSERPSGPSREPTRAYSPVVGWLPLELGILQRGCERGVCLFHRPIDTAAVPANGKER